VSFTLATRNNTNNNNNSDQISKNKQIKKQEQNLINAHFLRGKCLFNLKRFNEAHNSLDTVINLQPENEKVKIVIKILL
jgi:hypothetical protein